MLAAPEKPVADFYSPRVLDQQNGNEIGPSEEISFIDTSKGLPTSWLWDFGDGNTSTEQNPTHVYGAIGGYTVTLTVENAAGNNNTSKYGYVLVNEASGDIPERASQAYFSSSATSGDAPFKVTFHDETGYAPYSSTWTFGDGSQQYLLWTSNSDISDTNHTYLEPGQYTVALFNRNPAGITEITKYHYINVTGLTKPYASFTSEKVSVPKSLTIKFTDISIGNPTSWLWDFGDGISSNEQNPTHTYSASGNYTVNLTVSNTNGTYSKLAILTVFEPPIAEMPIANFNTNTTSGYAPLTVQFTDLSQNETSRSWDFNNDGIIDSNDTSPFYTYTDPGFYIVNLTVNFENGKSSRLSSITVLEGSNSNGSSNDSNGESGNSNRGSSHSSSGSSGGGVGGSPEPQNNVEAKELSQAFITNGNSVKFDFPQKVTPVVSISFDSKKTVGKTTTIVEMLNNKSTLVSVTPSDEINKYLNIWVGNSGFATEKNIANAVVCFKVEKSWIQDKNLGKFSITLNRYNDKKWSTLTTNLSGEDDKYLYFVAQTPGFSPFAITGKTVATNEYINKTQPQSDNQGDKQGNTSNLTSAEQKEKTSISGFEIIYGIIGLLGVFQYRRR